MSDNTPDIDTARGRAAALVALIDALGAGVDAEVIERAALVPLTDQAAQAAFNLGCGILMQMDTLTAILMGACSERIAMFASLGPSAPKALARRPRRPRPTAAERDQAAAAWLAGPAWDIVDSPERFSGQPRAVFCTPRSLQAGAR
jgi:hypothetical protein